MIWWGVFLALNVMFEVAFRRFVPFVHRWVYVKCPKDGMYWLSFSLFHSIWIVAAIQNVIAPADTPRWQHLGGVAFFVAGNALLIWARAVNQLFTPTLIYVAPHLRVTHGPYRFCNHPGYIGMVIAAHGVLFILGQWWAIFPMIGYVTLIVHRITHEDELLSGKIQL